MNYLKIVLNNFAYLLFSHIFAQTTTCRNLPLQFNIINSVRLGRIELLHVLRIDIYNTTDRIEELARHARASGDDKLTN